MSHIPAIARIAISFLMRGFTCIFHFKHKKADLCYAIDADPRFHLWHMEALFVFEMKLSHVHAFKAVNQCI